MYAARTGLLVIDRDYKIPEHDESRVVGTHSSLVPGTDVVELFGFPRTEPTARSRDALRSFKSFVCCANLRSRVGG